MLAGHELRSASAPDTQAIETLAAYESISIDGLFISSIQPMRHPISRDASQKSATAQLLRFALAHAAKAISLWGHAQPCLRAVPFCRALAATCSIACFADVAAASITTGGANSASDGSSAAAGANDMDQCKSADQQKLTHRERFLKSLHVA